jgi:adenine-specific DNA methylase
MTQVKKLIEVAMPIKEISAESVRDKSIRHGHISTLHLWWARRPSPVCRAVDMLQKTGHSIEPCTIFLLPLFCSLWLNPPN